jgi:hypothetical protein
MISPPFYLLPQTISFHTLPDFGTAKSKTELMTDYLARTGLYFHWLQRTQPLDPGRVSIEISSAATRITNVYMSKDDSLPFSQGKSASDKLAFLVLYCEVGFFPKFFIRIF